MHNPVRLLAVGSSASVENEGLPHTNLLVGVSDALVPPCCLPKPRTRRPVGPRPSWVLPVLVAEKVPLVLRRRSDPTSLYTIYIYNRNKLYMHTHNESNTTKVTGDHAHSLTLIKDGDNTII